MAREYKLPVPSAYLDPLTEVTTCFYYAVPKYYNAEHPNTRWLISMIRRSDIDRIRRKMELTPEPFRSSYFQLLDHPQMYISSDPTALPLFHKQAVLYLSCLGVAFYLKSTEAVQLIIRYRGVNGESLYNMRDPQYATHVQEVGAGDFHAYPLSVIMMRMGTFDCAPDMLEQGGWNPHEPICMPARRRFERRAFYFQDWLEYILWLLHERPMLQLARLAFCLTSSDQYAYQRLPIEALIPESEEDRLPIGLIDVDDLPQGAHMIGTKSLLDIAQDYSVYLECKERYYEISNCFKQMVSDGLNPQVIMAQAQDFDGGDVEEGEGDAEGNDNNNAAAGDKKRHKKGPKQQGPYASEATRILLHALNTNAKPKNKTPLHLLLDAVTVFVKRNTYLIATSLASGKKGRGKASKKGANEDLQKALQLAAMRKRDARNAIVLLLNIMQQQFDHINRLNKVQKGAGKPVHKNKQHVDPAKQASNKQILLARTLKRLVGMLFQILLHSHEVLHFVETDFPTYNYEAKQVDFRLHPGLEHTLRNVQLEVMAAFSHFRDAYSYLTLDEMQRACEIKEMYLNLRLGKAPPQPLLDTEAGEKLNRNPGAKRGKEGGKNASNISNSEVPPRPMDESEQCNEGNAGDEDEDEEDEFKGTDERRQAERRERLRQLLISSAGNAKKGMDGLPGLCLEALAKGEVKRRGRVSFVRVKPPPRTKPSQQQQQQQQQSQGEKHEAAEQEEEDNNKEASERQEQQQQQQQLQGQQQQQQQQKTPDDVVERLSQQIAELRRSAEMGNAADGVLADVYKRIIDELLISASGGACRSGFATSAEDEAVDENDWEQQPGSENHWDATIEESDELGQMQQEQHQHEEEHETPNVFEQLEQDTVQNEDQQNRQDKTETTTTGHLWRAAAAASQQHCVNGIPTAAARRRVGGRKRLTGGGGLRKQHFFYQKARVYDAPPKGTEFELNSDC